MLNFELYNKVMNKKINTDKLLQTPPRRVGLFNLLEHQALDPAYFITGQEGFNRIKHWFTEESKQHEFDHIRKDLPRNLRFKYQRDKGQRYLVSRSFHNDQVYKILYDEKKTKYSCEFTLLINNKLFLTTSNLDEIKDYINEAYDNSRK